MGTEDFQGMEFGNGFAPFRNDGHLFSVAWIAADGRVDDPVRRRDDVGSERKIDLADRPLLELTLDMETGPFGEGDDHEPGRVSVQSVDDTGAALPSHAGELAKACEERVDGGAGRVTGARVHDHAGRLVDNHQLIILIDDVEGDRFGLQRLGLTSGDRYFDDLPTVETVTGLGDHLPVDGREAVSDQILNPGSRYVRYPIGQVFV